jgi:hypothetical protein
VGCRLTAAECFHKNIVVRDGLNITECSGGWFTMPHPTRIRGKPVRLRVGDKFHIFYTDLAKDDEQVIFDWLVKRGVPGGCLKRPVSSASVSRPASPAKEGSSEGDGKLADIILDLAFGDGSSTDRMVAMVVAALGGEFPEGPMVGVFAEKLRVSERTLYRATAEVRRRNRSW